MIEDQRAFENLVKYLDELREVHTLGINVENEIQDVITVLHKIMIQK
jgi:hypothetical protein